MVAPKTHPPITFEHELVLGKWSLQTSWNEVMRRHERGEIQTQSRVRITLLWSKELRVTWNWRSKEGFYTAAHSGSMVLTASYWAWPLAVWEGKFLSSKPPSWWWLILAAWRWMQAVRLRLSELITPENTDSGWWNLHRRSPGQETQMQSP